MDTSEKFIKDTSFRGMDAADWTIKLARPSRMLMFEK
jgi:hypothetical protein